MRRSDPFYYAPYDLPARLGLKLPAMRVIELHCVGTARIPGFKNLRRCFRSQVLTVAFCILKILINVGGKT